jgi:hypothetical protein
MKKFAILRNDRTILVHTPKPYVVDAYKDSDMFKEELEDIRSELDEHTKFLYNCLRLLGIRRTEAIRENYTLNIDTGEKLLSMAQHKGNISHEMRMVILNHKW